MNYFTKKNIAIWAIIILVLINILTLLLLWRTQLDKPDPDFSRIYMRHERMKKSSQYLEHHYNFDKMQIEQFFDFKDKHYNQSSGKLEEIKNLRKEIYNELFNEHPDTNKVNEIIDKIGGKYSEITQMNFYHFLEMKKLFPDDKQDQYIQFVKDIIKRMDYFRHGHNRDMQHRSNCKPYK